MYLDAFRLSEQVTNAQAIEALKRILHETYGVQPQFQVLIKPEVLYPEFTGLSFNCVRVLADELQNARQELIDAFDAQGITAHWLS